MTSGLRKTHQFAWILIAITVPVLIFFSIKNLAVFGTKKAQPVVVETPKSNPIKVIENDQIKTSLFDNSVEVIVKSTLKTSSSVVYTINEKGEKEKSLGQVTTVGIYNFTLDTTIKGIVIFDEIKEIEITKLLF